MEQISGHGSKREGGRKQELHGIHDCGMLGYRARPESGARIWRALNAVLRSSIVILEASESLTELLSMAQRYHFLSASLHLPFPAARIVFPYSLPGITPHHPTGLQGSIASPRSPS